MHGEFALGEVRQPEGSELAAPEHLKQEPEIVRKFKSEMQLNHLSGAAQEYVVYRDLIWPKREQLPDLFRRLTSLLKNQTNRTFESATPEMCKMARLIAMATTDAARESNFSRSSRREPVGYLASDERLEAGSELMEFLTICFYFDPKEIATWHKHSIKDGFISKALKAAERSRPQTRSS